MKISCNVIEDLLPLYADNVASEDSQKLIEEHLKECSSCKIMLAQMQKIQNTDLSRNCLEDANVLKKIRSRICRKRIFCAVLASAVVLAGYSTANYLYCNKQTYLSWEDSGLYIKDEKLYSTYNKSGRFFSVHSPDSKNDFLMMAETAEVRRMYPADQDTNMVLIDFKDYEDAYQRDPSVYIDETTLPSGCIENLYFVDPEYVNDAYDLWNYADDPEKAAKKISELASHCTLLWSVH